MVQTMRRFAVLFIAGCMAACLVLLGGCSSGNSASSSASSASSEEFQSVAEEQEEILVLGQEEPGALAITFTNEMGAPIQNIAFVAAGSGAEPEFLMTEEQTVADDGQVRIFQQPGQTDGLFDVVIQCEGNRYTLHGVNLQTTQAATLHRQGDIAYLDTTIDGNVVSTLREEADLAAEAAAAADRALEEPEITVDETEVTVDEPQYYDTGSTGTGTTQQPAPTYDSTPSAPEQSPAQGEDSCVGDVVLR